METSYPSNPAVAAGTAGDSLIALARKAFHARLLAGPLNVTGEGVASIADSSNQLSVALSRSVVDQLGQSVGERFVAQTSGQKFEENVCLFIKETFTHCGHLRPGIWEIGRPVDFRHHKDIRFFEQYQHLMELERACAKSAELQALLGNGYVIKPDILVLRQPESDEAINASACLVDAQVSMAAALRRACSQFPILHASISCKWTLRSDRAQNARAEALTLIRHRKGRLPHIMVVTCEPLPSRLASIALGTGDIDCVYHFALPELVRATETDAKGGESRDLLQMMIDGQRIKDISNLPLDLSV